MKSVRNSATDQDSADVFLGCVLVMRFHAASRHYTNVQYMRACDASNCLHLLIPGRFAQVQMMQMNFFECLIIANNTNPPNAFCVNAMYVCTEPCVCTTRAQDLRENCPTRKFLPSAPMREIAKLGLFPYSLARARGRATTI